MNRAITLGLATLVAATSLSASTRLTYMIGGRPVALSWPAASFPIAYRLDPRAAVQGGATVQQSFDSWGAQGTNVSFLPPQIGATAAGKDGVNSVSVNDEMFATSGFLAFTTTWFDDAGVIHEADIQVDKNSIQAPNYGALVEHEVGHLLGLDHSANLSAAMYPFVSPDSRGGLDADDRQGVAALYPQLGAAAMRSVKGTVSGSSSGVFGAQVVLVDRSGSPVASTLTDSNGNFEIGGIPDGDYRVYAEPLNGPVGPSNLSGVWRTASADFSTEVQPVRVGEGLTEVTLRADRPATLNPRWIGTFPEGTTDIRMTSNAWSIKPGTTVSIAVGGDGIISGMTTFEITSDKLQRVSEFQYGPNYLWATFRVAPDAAASALVVLVHNGTDVATLTGGLKVVEPAGRQRAVR